MLPTEQEMKEKWEAQLAKYEKELSAWEERNGDYQEPEAVPSGS